MFEDFSLTGVQDKLQPVFDSRILRLSSKSIGKFWFFLTRERKLSLDFLFSAIAFGKFGHSRGEIRFS